MIVVHRSNVSKGAMRKGLISKLLQNSYMLGSFSTSFHSRKIVTSCHQHRPTTMTSEQFPHGIFVQTLPVIIPPPNENSANERKILLCKWGSGDYKDRYTGLIKQISGDQFQFIHQRENLHQPGNVLRQIAFDLLPSSLQPHVKEEMKLVGKLRFADPPVYDEYVYLANLTLPSSGKLTDIKSGSGGEKNISTFDFQQSIRFDEHLCFWFNWEEIPFTEMPADDEVWYPKVLWEGSKVKGSFTFGGWSERTIKSFELFTVDGF